MARVNPGLVYVGIKKYVVALDRRTGSELWRTPLKGTGSFVCVFRDDDLLFATCSGEIFCLDPKTGAVLWHNPLKGLGFGLTSLAGEFGSTTSTLAATAAAETQRRQAAHAAAAG